MRHTSPSKRSAQRPPSTRRFAPPPLTAGWPLLAMLALFLAAGLFGHDPWKNEDAVHFGVVWRAALAGEWMQFHLSGSTAPEAPLYYWLARLAGLLGGAITDLPNAIRLASLACTASAAVLLYQAARMLYGKETAIAAPLALVGCLGFMVQSHDTQPMLATITALCAVLASLAGLHLKRRHATPAFAISLAAVFLSSGLSLLPAVILLCMIALFAAEVRSKLAIKLLLALLGAVALSLPWLLALSNANNGAFDSFVVQELSRLSGVHAPVANLAAYLEQILWFSWPAWPLAAWGVWTRWHARRSVTTWLGVSAFAALLLNLAWTTEARSPSFLILLPPLALLAAQGVGALRRSASNGFDWFSRLTFTLIAALLWLGWCAMHFGVPPKIAHNILRLSPGFQPDVHILAALFAAVASVLWLWFIIREPRSQLRGLGHWVAGCALTWLLVVSLWFPWIEYLKSYRPVGAELAKILPPTANACVTTQGMGDAHLGALEYALGRPFNDGAEESCRFLLTLGGRTETLPPAEWRRVWEGHRPGDRKERLRLYHRG